MLRVQLSAVLRCFEVEWDGGGLSIDAIDHGLQKVRADLLPSVLWNDPQRCEVAVRWEANGDQRAETASQTSIAKSLLVFLAAHDLVANLSYV